MKRFTIILAFTAVLLLAAALPDGITNSQPFIGNWKGIDPFDGSNLTLWIVGEARSGGQVFELRENDDRTGPWCSGPAEMRAVGVLEGENSIAASMVWWCLPAGSDVLYFISDTFNYDPVTDTITSTDGTVFYRTP